MRKFLLVATAVLLAACGSKADSSAVPASGQAAPVEVAETPPTAAEPLETSTAAGPVAVEVVVAEAEAPAKSAVWTIDKAKSRVEFTGSQTGKDFSGSFSKFDAAIIFDPADLSSARIKATIDMASAATGDKQRDAALPSSDWFSIKDFPTATFEASDIRAAGSGYEARGKLTIRNAAKDLTLPFSLTITGDRATADGKISLVRTDFGVGQGEFSTGEWVGLDVGVSVHIEAAR